MNLTYAFRRNRLAASLTGERLPGGAGLGQHAYHAILNPLRAPPVDRRDRVAAEQHRECMWSPSQKSKISFSADRRENQEAVGPFAQRALGVPPRRWCAACRVACGGAQRVLARVEAPSTAGAPQPSHPAGAEGPPIAQASGSLTLKAAPPPANRLLRYNQLPSRLCPAPTRQHPPHEQLSTARRQPCILMFRGAERTRAACR